MIKVISFDIGGTLVKFNQTVDKYNLKELALVSQKPYEIVREVYKYIFQRTKGSIEELVNNFCEMLEIEVTNELMSFFKAKFRVTEESFVDLNALDVIKKLKEKGYKIILFSNACCLNENALTEEFLNNVDNVFYSYDLGYTKSEEESYKIIEETLNCKPNEILHIGDTLKSDYLEPIKFGWKAIFYGKTDDNNIKNIQEINELLTIDFNQL